MNTEYMTVVLDGEGEYEEKHSRFLSVVTHVESEDEVNEILSAIRKKHYSARHHCYAYSIGIDKEIEKFSDDGEPSGTAGSPILSVLRKKELKNTLIVVTRYFGGTLLGTGGLVRSYTNSAISGIEDAKIVTVKRCSVYMIVADYNDFGKIRYYLEHESFSGLKIEYGQSVMMTVPIPMEKVESVQKKVTDLTQGKSEMEELKQVYYAEENGEVYTFDA